MPATIERNRVIRQFLSIIFPDFRLYSSFRCTLSLFHAFTPFKSEFYMVTKAVYMLPIYFVWTKIRGLLSFFLSFFFSLSQSHSIFHSLPNFLFIFFPDFYFSLHAWYKCSMTFLRDILLFSAILFILQRAFLHTW